MRNGLPDSRQNDVGCSHYNFSDMPIQEKFNANFIH
jgi:hypothetical protein